MDAPTHSPTRAALAVGLGVATSGMPKPAQVSAPVMLAAAGTHAAPAAKAPGAGQYIAVARVQRSQDVLQTEAMWKLAQLHHSGGQCPERTAHLLFAFARDAQRFAEPEIEAKALLEATLLYKKAYIPEKAFACADRLEVLIASPSLSDDLREEIERRIVRD